MEQQIRRGIMLCIDSLRFLHNERPVVLYLNPTMIGPGDNYLPTLNIEGDDGFYRFPEYQRAEFAAYFGPRYDQAQQRVREINEAFGLDEARARGIAVDIIVRSTGG